MSIKLHRLLMTSSIRPVATLDLEGKSHLVFGPTDTGKSYIVQCIKFGLGSQERPADIGYSDGYTGLLLQVVTSDQQQYTIYRDLVTSQALIQKGFLEAPLSKEDSDSSMAEILISKCNGENKQIIVKQGVRANLALGDLRFSSLFGEMKTLSDDPFLGKKDSNSRTRYRSALSLTLSGIDDSDVLLPSSTKEQTVAKGQIQAIDRDLTELKGCLPRGLTREQVEEEFEQLSGQVDSMSQYIRFNIDEIRQLKDTHTLLNANLRKIAEELIVLGEAADRFVLLQKKYANDIDRLGALGTAAAVFDSFETKPCPLCHTDIQHQLRHILRTESESRSAAILSGAMAEKKKIQNLQNGLTQALTDINAELSVLRSQHGEQERLLAENEERQRALSSPSLPRRDFDLSGITERKTILSVAIRDYERIEQLQKEKDTLVPHTKRQKGTPQHDLAIHANSLCVSIFELLNAWKVPEVQNISFDEKEMDIKINQRKRTSFGKGKRGIFLSAYVIALMEYAIERGHPHFGFVVIDSPVVTYKHPKHGGADGLPETVKDHFYSWLAAWQGAGQLIVLENEEPGSVPLVQIPHTEFLGNESKSPGRKGFLAS